MGRCGCAHNCRARSSRSDYCSCSGGPLITHRCKGLLRAGKRKAHKADAPLVLTAGAVNGDNRDAGRSAKIQTEDQLESELVRVTSVTLSKPALMTVTEARTIKIGQAALAKLNGYAGIVNTFPSQGDVVCSWYQNDVWEAEQDYEFSAAGKSQVVYLQTKDGQGERKRIAHVSVHLPHKQGRKFAYAALKAKYQAIVSSHRECDALVISGDFNLNPERIVKEFDDIRPLFTLDNGFTTKKNRRCDNFVVSDGIDVEKSVATIMSNCNIFSHFPIHAKLQIAK